MITDDYVAEKIEAYNIAIEALRHHEPSCPHNMELAEKLRNRLADKLDREIQRWLDDLNRRTL